MNDAVDVKFTILDASGKTTELNFEVDGINVGISEMYAEVMCGLDDDTWTKPDIKLIQERLNALGYDVGAPDGAFGAKSRETLRRWQMDSKLPATGKIDFATVTGLGFYQKANDLASSGHVLGNF